MTKSRTLQKAAIAAGLLFPGADPTDLEIVAGLLAGKAGVKDEQLRDLRHRLANANSTTDGGDAADAARVRRDTVLRELDLMSDETFLAVVGWEKKTMQNKAPASLPPYIKVGETRLFIFSETKKWLYRRRVETLTPLDTAPVPRPTVLTKTRRRPGRPRKPAAPVSATPNT